MVVKLLQLKCLSAFSCLLFASAACAPVGETAVSPTPPPATQLPATATAVLVTPETPVAAPTAVPSPTIEQLGELSATAKPDSSLCPVNTAETVARLPVPTDKARVLFLNDDLWLWREETGTAEALTSGGDVTAYQPAPDYKTIAYLQAGDLWLWRNGQTAVHLTEASQIKDFTVPHDSEIVVYTLIVGDGLYELWVVNSDGSNPRYLAAPAETETRSQYPEAYAINFLLNWVEDSHILSYFFYPLLPELGEAPPQTVVWIDADSGTTLSSPPASAVPEKISRYRVEMTPTLENYNKFRLIDSNGRIALTLTSPHQNAWSFSPDERYLVAAVMEGSVIVDLTDLSQQLIPVPFRDLGWGHGGMGLPPNWWLDNSTWLAIVPADNDGVGFTLWQVDAAAGTAVVLLANLPGNIMPVTLSPDQQTLAFMTRNQLHLYHLATGEDEIYDSSSGIWFDHWLDDPSTFIYSRRSSDGTQGCLLFGQSNQPPIPLTFVDGNPEWLDKTRFLLASIGYLNTGETYMATGKIYFGALPANPTYVGEVYGPAEGQRPFVAYKVYFETP